MSIPLVITNKYIQKTLIDKVTTELSTQSKGEVSVQGINFSFYSGLILEDVSLKDPNGNLVASMDEFHLDVRWRKLFRKKVQVEEIILNKLEKTAKKYPVSKSKGVSTKYNKL
jgi:uncharacterized protein involved in outer membrane biogenesis